MPAIIGGIVLWGGQALEQFGTSQKNGLIAVICPGILSVWPRIDSLAGADPPRLVEKIKSLSSKTMEVACAMNCFEEFSVHVQLQMHAVAA